MNSSAQFLLLQIFPPFTVAVWFGFLEDVPLLEYLGSIAVFVFLAGQVVVVTWTAKEQGMVAKVMAMSSALTDFQEGEE